MTVLIEPPPDAAMLAEAFRLACAAVDMARRAYRISPDSGRVLGAVFESWCAWCPGMIRATDGAHWVHVGSVVARGSDHLPEPTQTRRPTR